MDKTPVERPLFIATSGGGLNVKTVTRYEDDGKNLRLHVDRPDGCTSYYLSDNEAVAARKVISAWTLEVGEK